MEATRNYFKFRTKMIDCKFNFKNKKEYSEELWRCDSCESSIETNQHILYCPAYAELRIGKDINSLQDLTEYFSKVLIIREKLKINR